MASTKHASYRSKRTKIVATIGPASNNAEVIRRLILAGADVFRLNFSHGTHEDHQTVIRIIRDLSREMSTPYGLLADLSGPKLRVGSIRGESILLQDGGTMVLTSDEADGTDHRVGVNFKGFHEVASPGERIVLDDGKLQVLVEFVAGTDVHCRVLHGGLLRSRKGVNLPDTKLPIPALTEKDCGDLKFALDAGVDMVALSFVRSPDDIHLARETMREFGRVVPLLAKIEKKEATDRLEEIIRASDGAMVARGDLGIEMPIELIPTTQKRIIHLCNRLAKPVITATQMLESMMSNPTPTRAEVTDIYNAILDGTDAVMLSGETAAGEFPVEAVEVMDHVAAEAEQHFDWNKGLDWVVDGGEVLSTTHVVCNSAVAVAEKLKLDLILVPTSTGYTAFHVSRFKPSVPIFACSTDPGVVNWMCLGWGVKSFVMENPDAEAISRSETDALVDQMIRTAKHYGMARSGQRAVVLGGVPLGISRHTNYLRVVEIP